MKLIVGLGNIGKEYEKSKHNIGFMVADCLAKRWNADWRTDKLSFVAEYRGSEKIILLKPRTYMNLSGNAVRHYAEYYKIMPHDIAVLQDDLDLPSGKVRVRRKGTAGGHNGIKSIIENLGTTEFPRFKIGIGHPENEKRTVVSHVLSGFAANEKEVIEEAVNHTADAVVCWLNDGIDAAMNRFNS